MRAGVRQPHRGGTTTINAYCRESSAGYVIQSSCTSRDAMQQYKAGVGLHVYERLGFGSVQGLLVYLMMLLST